MRILIVDDEHLAAEALGMLLTANGHVVSIAHDGSSGISVGVAEQFDVAVLDLGMPVVDGFAVALALRAHYGTTVRLVAYTGFTQDTMKQRARAAGFDAFVMKPASLQTILSALLTTANSQFAVTSGGDG